MIVVSLKRSYPNLIDDTRNEAAGLFMKLEAITRGDWPKMTPSTLEGYLDYVVGTYNDMIVSAYPIDHVEINDNGTICFAAPEGTTSWMQSMLNSKNASNASNTPGEWLIGCPMPGGPWRQGESRGTRRYSIEDFLDDHPELGNRIGEDFGGRMADNLVAHYATGKQIAVEDYPQLASVPAVQPASTPSTGVTVVRQPGGTVVVTIPTGTRAQILIDPSQPLQASPPQ
jgi:hypothetical protein